MAGMKRSAKAKSSSRKRARVSKTSTPKFGKDLTVTCKRKWWSTSWPFSSAATTGFYRAFSPQFGDIPNIAEYTALFDEYKVTNVTVTLLPRHLAVTNPASGVGTFVVQNDQFYVTYGTDRKLEVPSGVYSASNLNAFLEIVPDAKTVPLDKPVKISYKPYIVNQTTAGTQIMPCPWMSTASTAQPMQCAYAFMHDTAFAAINNLNFACDIMFEMTFKLRGQR